MARLLLGGKTLAFGWRRLCGVAAGLHWIVVGLLRSSSVLSEFNLGPVGTVLEHELFAHQWASGLELRTRLQDGMCLTRQRNLVRGDPKTRVGGRVVYYPQVRVECARAVDDSVAVAGMDGELFYRIVVSGLVDENLERLW